jgi:hypothetical protein
MGYIGAFGRFWYDFLIGDRPELFVGPIVGLAAVAVVIAPRWPVAAGFVLFVLVVASGGWGVVRALATGRASPTTR